MHKACSCATCIPLRSTTFSNWKSMHRWCFLSIFNRLRAWGENSRNNTTTHSLSSREKHVWQELATEILGYVNIEQALQCGRATTSEAVGARNCVRADPQPRINPHTLHKRRQSSQPQQPS